MIQTVNFKPSTDPKMLCTCKHPDCDQRSVKQTHLNRIQKAREIIRLPMVITSGGRCPNHPSETHRTTPADHQKGMAVDVACNGQSRGNYVAAAIAAGCNSIGVAKTFVHFGYRPELPEGHITMWTY